MTQQTIKPPKYSYGIAPEIVEGRVTCERVKSEYGDIYTIRVDGHLVGAVCKIRVSHHDTRGNSRVNTRGAWAWKYDVNVSLRKLHSSNWRLEYDTRVRAISALVDDTRQGND